LNIGSAPSPTPEDIRKDRMPIVTEAPAPKAGTAASMEKQHRDATADKIPHQRTEPPERCGSRHARVDIEGANPPNELPRLIPAPGDYPKLAMAGRVVRPAFLYPTITADAP
jgi:hypothetical protein